MAARGGGRVSWDASTKPPQPDTHENQPWSPNQSNPPTSTGSPRVPLSRYNNQYEEEQTRHNEGLLPPGKNTDTTQDLSRSMRDLDVKDVEKPRKSGSAHGHNSKSRICMKCGESLAGQFVRALGGTFHLDCFRCQDCSQIVASKFFPVENETGDGQYPLCETDYFRRLNLLCHKCGGALRGSYVTALDRKYHVDHFTCSVCPTTFGASDSYYEHDGQVYCHYHYSTKFAQRCHGCQTAILKQFVEIFKNGQNQYWHPECYMIHKYWNVNLALSRVDSANFIESEENATEEKRVEVRMDEERMEERVYRIWSVLSSFEESSAACISDMLLHVSNGAYVDGVLVAKKFILHVDILFTATDRLDQHITAQGFRGLQYGREAKLLCKKIVAFFDLLSKSQDGGVRRLGVTQELLSLVTSLAHYLKLLIRISLQGALKLEKEKSDTVGLNDFLEELAHLAAVKDTEVTLDYGNGDSGLVEKHADSCHECNNTVDDESFKAGDRRWHANHLMCATCSKNIADHRETEEAIFSQLDQKLFCPDCTSKSYPTGEIIQGVERVTRLQQYVFLLRVALARLLKVLRSGGTLPHTSDDPNLNDYDSHDGHRITPDGRTELGLLSASNRSKSHGGFTNEKDGGSSYEETVGEMKRLRSTRMDKHLSTSIKKARTSRIIDGPEGQMLGADLNKVNGANNQMRIIEDREASNDQSRVPFSNHEALTLDDIPRIVAAEQAKEQRPNAFKHSRNQLISGGRQPKLGNVQQHDFTGDGDKQFGGDYYQRPKKFFSELTALEYFIVRHIAVLQMQPLLEGHFNLEELLGLIESRKPTFWNKFGRAFKNDKAKASKKKGVFGVGLETLVEREGVESTDGVGPGALRVPALLDDTIRAMRQMDMSVEGVFRKNGNIRGLKDLAEKLDAKEIEVDLTKESPVQVAALLKRFLRELPDPLLTYKLHTLFTTSQKIADEEKRKRVLHLTCCLLPKAHRDSAEILCCFLNWTASFSQVDEEIGSKMDTHNLATVITPNILRQPDTGPKAGPMDDSFLAIEAVNMLIDHNDQLCQVPSDIQDLLRGDPSVFSNESDITTKEILKRYGAVVSKPMSANPSHTAPMVTATTFSPENATTLVENSDMDSANQSQSNTRNKDANGAKAVAPQRIDIDPHQQRAWQNESSVRHVQPGVNGNGPITPNDMHSPQSQGVRFDFPYQHQKTGSSESAGEFGVTNPTQTRNTMFPRQRNGVGTTATG
ncbi:hypothetical protein MMC25_008187 [Agyrium rufum]|nr:hypothetical protein [Agyrium rufum]